MSMTVQAYLSLPISALTSGKVLYMKQDFAAMRSQMFVYQIDVNRNCARPLEFTYGDALFHCQMQTYIRWYKSTQITCNCRTIYL